MLGTRSNPQTADQGNNDDVCSLLSKWWYLLRRMINLAWCVCVMRLCHSTECCFDSAEVAPMMEHVTVVYTDDDVQAQNAKIKILALVSAYKPWHQIAHSRMDDGPSLMVSETAEFKVQIHTPRIAASNLMISSWLLLIRAKCATILPGKLWSNSHFLIGAGSTATYPFDRRPAGKQYMLEWWSWRLFFDLLSFRQCSFFQITHITAWSFHCLHAS